MGLDGSVREGHFSYTKLHYEDGAASLKQFLDHVAAGLSVDASKEDAIAHPKTLSSMYFYDDKGSEIYQEITRLREYYPTRTELAILERHGQVIANRFLSNKQPINLVELGAGDGHKTEVLLQYLIHAGVEFEYFPIDISRKAIEQLLRAKDQEWLELGLKCHGLVADHMEGLRWLRTQRPGVHNVVLFLGSSIGNYDLVNAEKFLRTLRTELSPGDNLLVGFDMKKDPHILQNAYADPHGVTARFNLNLLERMNRELGASFDPDQFFHHAFYNPGLGSMESWLVSKCEQRVYIEALQRDVMFLAYEGVRTEYSFKYTRKQIKRLSEAAGLGLVEAFSDENQWFTDALLVVKG
ncbi:Histidine N-alpha-methyltransferase [Porphyridium purpureum]|uniref:Histidine N-alpha-methyltransferase n=1 Tax=Porphyridium purpureum TaxID=35688 RepID=A0A5J4Z9V9_PORPP|nr:Histidine N-alpha-methyltransferase [Porphyridium purpureum]|eukprot:POR6303..scf295_1